MKSKLATFLFLLAATAVATEELHADGWWWGGSPFANRLYRSDREIPFYAEFPPVYYSHIVPRTYGQSPYAYWPGPFTPMMTPEPIMVPNPYFDVVPEEVPAPAQKSKKRKTSDDNSAQNVYRGPAVVLNPYVDQQPVYALNEK